MNLLKKLLCISVLVVLMAAQAANSDQNPSLQKIIEISPSALDVMINAFDNLIVYFHAEKSQIQLDGILQQFQVVKQQIRGQFPNDHSLFGYVNLTQDYKDYLTRFGKQDGFLVINRFTGLQQCQERYQENQLFTIYQQISHPKLSLSYTKEALSKSTQFNNILFKFKTWDKLKEYNKIYEKSKFYLEDLNIGTYAVPVEKDENEGIFLYNLNTVKQEYKFTNMTISQIAIELVQLVNIDTLPFVTKLNSSNIHRVFGGAISNQLLLLYKKEDNSEQIDRLKNTFIQAASYNKLKQLAYERVLFAQMNEEFFEKQFNEKSASIFSQASKGLKNYAIIFTKTDYDGFNLNKYVLKLTESQVNTQDIITFIQNVRLKKLDPVYKSQQEPKENENKGILHKIVGTSFIREVYQKSDSSIIVLFIDSKDPNQYKDVKKVLEHFALKYKKQFKDKLSFGIFDLAKNQHKLFYLKEAPQIVLFQKSNKKHTKYFKISEGVSLQSLENWVRREVPIIQFEKMEELL